MSIRTSIHGQWSSRIAFLLAATGSSVGLGNIWKFPYITGQNGGGAFVIVYLVCILLIGVPLLMAETLIGRRGRQSPINTLETLAWDEGSRCSWRFVGVVGIFAAWLIVAFYSVIAGWTLAYTARMAVGVFDNVTASGAANIFFELIEDPERLLAWHTLFMIMTVTVVSRGVRSGIEQAVKILMPLLFILLLFLAGYSALKGNFDQSLDFMFSLNFSAMTPAGFLAALGHAFFTLSLGMGAIMIYGSYLPSETSIPRVTMMVAITDTLVALLAGMTIFPIVFATGLEPSSGVGLVFQTLPVAFGQMPGGMFFGMLFFVLLVFAAWTSAISLLEPIVAWLVESLSISRIRASIWAGVSGWLLGIVILLSFNHWAFEFDFLGQKKINGMFDVFDILTSAILLPLGGLALAIFAGWVMSRTIVAEELGGEGIGFQVWYFLIKFIVPFAMLLIFLNAVGVF